MKYYCIISVLSLVLLGGCATAPEEVATAGELYTEAKDLEGAANYTGADEKYRELKSTYPTSPYTQQAILDQIYGYLNRREFALAVSAADEFISLYPDHPQTPYAMYMKGVIYFREDRGVLDKINKQDTSERDPQLMRLSYQAFRELLDTYPDSQYVPDATKRMRFLINGLARNEMHVAYYYFNRDAYVAAAGRAKNVLDIYPDSNSSEAALVLLLKVYQALEADAAAEDIRRILELNFPNSAALRQEG